MLTNSSIVITGGTDSFGKTFVPMTLAKYNPKRLVIYSRDEMKQWDMAHKFEGDGPVRFFTRAVSSPKCKKCSVMLLKVERIRCKQLSGALEAERFARPRV